MFQGIARTLATVVLVAGLAVGGTGTAAASTQTDTAAASAARSTNAASNCYYYPANKYYIQCDSGWYESTPWMLFDQKFYIASSGIYCGKHVWAKNSFFGLNYVGWESSGRCGF